MRVLLNEGCLFARETELLPPADIQGSSAQTDMARGERKEHTDSALPGVIVSGCRANQVYDATDVVLMKACD